MTCDCAAQKGLLFPRSGACVASRTSMRLYARGRRFGNGFFGVIAFWNDKGWPRLGLAVAVRTAGAASSAIASAGSSANRSACISTSCLPSTWSSARGAGRGMRRSNELRDSLANFGQIGGKSHAFCSRRACAMIALKMPQAVSANESAARVRCHTLDSISTNGPSARCSVPHADSIRPVPTMRSRPSTGSDCSAAVG